MKRKILVAVTGASGAILGVRLLEALRPLPEVQTHLIVSRWGAETLRCETDYSLEAVRALADVAYEEDDMTAPVASGSFGLDAMAVVPCSMKTLAGIAQGLSSSLIGRAADVMLKERRTLVLCPRETPLHEIHLENMLRLARMGVRIIPPMPAFYNRPQTIEDLLASYTMRALDALGVANELAPRWGGGET